MGGILRNWRVLGAALVAVAVIGGSYLIARGINDPSVAEASAETALLQAAASRDSTGDGLPDWQKVLYGIPLDATTTDYFHLGMTDGEAVAKGLVVPKAVANTSSSAASTDNGTLSDSFSKAFFSLYLNAKQANGGVELSSDQTQSLANEAFNQFLETFVPSGDSKSLQDLKIAGTGKDALMSFAADASTVLARYSVKKQVDEIKDLEAILTNTDPQKSSELSAIATMYQNYATGLSALTIPNELAEPMLRLINALALRATVYKNIAGYGTDPMLALVSVQQIAPSEIAWLTAFKDIGTIYADDGITAVPRTPSALFIQIALKVRAANP